MNWSQQQENALRAVTRWQSRRDSPVFRLFGYAGTGKTTLAKELAENTSGLVLFAAFTGKASQVLRQKGCHNANTIHSLIYRLERENGGNPTWKKNRNSDLRHASLLIVDECSMVDEEVGRDLLSYGVPILVLGDPAQLPPVKGEGFFTSAKPDVLLTEIHRQARDNPIIRIATDVREGRKLERGDHGAARIIDAADLDLQTIMEADQVLVGKNATRVSFNQELRKSRGFSGELPCKGERLVCLRNNKEKGTLNGSLWDVIATFPQSSDHTVGMAVKSSDDGEMASINVRREFFVGGDKDLPWFILKRTDQFTFGYVLTVHKAQGSQWNNVVLFDESHVFRDSARNWLYTGITRAASNLTVVM